MLQKRFLGGVLSALLTLTAGPAIGATIYVDCTAGGSNNGSSWANAYTSLTTALASCTSSDELWVAECTYRPDPVSPYDRSASFALVNGCDVYGGFAGTETGRTQRNPATNATILSGDNAGNDPGTNENAYHVVYVPSSVVAGSNTKFDGFTITAGYADFVSGTPSTSEGGGMRCGGELTIEQVTFTGNTSEIAGAGLFIAYSSPTVNRCRFTDNVYAYWGNAIGTLGAGSAVVTNCLFTGNGDNDAIYVQDNTLRLENCTVADNAAGVYVADGDSITIVNTIIWNNGDGSLAYQVSDWASVASGVTYSDIQGCTGSCGATNIDADPGFDANHRPSGSTIDAGSNSEVSTSKDLGGLTRILCDTVDMGAREDICDDE